MNISDWFQDASGVWRRVDHDDNDTTVAAVYDDGWVAYDDSGHESGPETGEEGKAKADEALVWHKILPSPPGHLGPLISQLASNALDRTRPKVAHADAVTWLQTLLPDSVDLVITDPAYESLEKHRAKGTTTRLAKSKASSNEWFPIFRNDRFDALLRELYRVMRPESHMYLLCDQETMFVVKPLAERHGFRFWKPIIWDKVTIGMGYHYRCRYELVLFFEKPGPGGKGRKLNDLGVPDVLTFPRVRNGYPTEKPVELLDVLVRQSSAPYELVIDPFCGSGSTGVAAVKARRVFHGCDVVEAAATNALKRIREAW